MDWLVVLFILFGVVMNILQKIKKDTARPPRPYHLPGPPPSLPPEGEKEVNIYREAPSWSMEEGEGGPTEGISLEGDFTTEPALVPEVLREQEELAREREAFYREAMALIQEEGEESFFDRESSRPGMEKAKKRSGEIRWFSTQEDLLRAMVALEVFGPPGGRRPF